MLARTAVADHDAETVVLSGACLPLTSVSVPYLAIRAAIAGFTDLRAPAAAYRARPTSP